MGIESQENLHCCTTWWHTHTHTHIHIYIYIYTCGGFNKFPDVFVQAYKIGVGSKKFSI